MGRIRKDNQRKAVLGFLAFALLQTLFIMVKKVPDAPFPDLPWAIVLIPSLTLFWVLVLLLVLAFINYDSDKLNKRDN